MKRSSSSSELKSSESSLVEIYSNESSSEKEIEKTVLDFMANKEAFISALEEKLKNKTPLSEVAEWCLHEATGGKIRNILLGYGIPLTAAASIVLLYIKFAQEYSGCISTSESACSVFWLIFAIIGGGGSNGFMALVFSPILKKLLDKNTEHTFALDSTTLRKMVAEIEKYFSKYDSSSWNTIWKPASLVVLAFLIATPFGLAYAPIDQLFSQPLTALKAILTVYGNWVMGFPAAGAIFFNDSMLGKVVRGLTLTATLPLWGPPVLPIMFGRYIYQKVQFNRLSVTEKKLAHLRDVETKIIGHLRMRLTTELKQTLEAVKKTYLDNKIYHSTKHGPWMPKEFRNLFGEQEKACTDRLPWLHQALRKRFGIHEEMATTGDFLNAITKYLNNHMTHVKNVNAPDSRLARWGTYVFQAAVGSLILTGISGFFTNVLQSMMSLANDLGLTGFAYFAVVYATAVLPAISFVDLIVILAPSAAKDLIDVFRKKKIFLAMSMKRSAGMVILAILVAISFMSFPGVHLLGLAEIKDLDKLFGTGVAVEVMTTIIFLLSYAASPLFNLSGNWPGVNQLLSLVMNAVFGWFKKPKQDSVEYKRTVGMLRLEEKFERFINKISMMNDKAIVESFFLWKNMPAKLLEQVATSEPVKTTLTDNQLKKMTEQQVKGHYKLGCSKTTPYAMQCLFTKSNLKSIKNRGATISISKKKKLRKFNELTDTSNIQGSEKSYLLSGSNNTIYSKNSNDLEGGEGTSRRPKSFVQKVKDALTPAPDSMCVIS